MQIPADMLVSMRRAVQPRMGIATFLLTSLVVATYFQGPIKTWAERWLTPERSSSPTAAPTMSGEIESFPRLGTPVTSREPCPGCGGG